MESKRQQKFSKLIQKDLSDIFQREIPDILNGNFVTVTVVRISPDLSATRVYCSVLLAKNPEEVIKNLNANKSAIRNVLGRRIRNQVRIVPHMHFFLDDTGEQASHMDRLISGLDIPPEKEDNK